MKKLTLLILFASCQGVGGEDGIYRNYRIINIRGCEYIECKKGELVHTADCANPSHCNCDLKYIPPHYNAVVIDSVRYYISGKDTFTRWSYSSTN